MHKLLSHAVLFLVFFAAASQALAGSQGTLRQCQKVKDKIDYYTDLRRAGGSSKSMEKWKQKRDHYHERYGVLRCSQWRNELR